MQADVAIQREGSATDDYFHVVLRYDRLRVVLHASALLAAEERVRGCIGRCGAAATSRASVGTYPSYSSERI